jgi:arylsulfatase A-like enzyme
MADTRPNIILFTTDQHRGDFISLAGHPTVETPNVDGLLEEGAYFPNAYTEIPSTTGARRVMLGGQANYTCGLIGYSGTEWHERNTVAQSFADAGYHCINVGWRNLHPRRKLYGFHNVVVHELREGVDDYWDWLREQVGPEAHEREHGSDANGWLGRPWHLNERYHATNWTVAETLKQIRHRDPTRPFFVWCSHLRPHSPYDPPQFFWDMYANQELPAPAVGTWAERHADVQPGIGRLAWKGKLTEKQTQRMLAGYMGCISHIDYQLGYLIEILRSWRLWDNTVLLFTADHGDMMGDHHLHRKCYAYEGSARIPMVMRFPKETGIAGEAREEVVGLQDVMPTLLDAAGVEIPESVTGQSMLKAAKGEPWREFFHGEHSPCYDLRHGMHYLTDGKWKYIWHTVTGEEQLFDLRSDRYERTDLANNPQFTDALELWRDRLVRLLGQRGDGFSDGEKLIRKTEWYGPFAGDS